MSGSKRRPIAIAAAAILATGFIALAGCGNESPREATLVLDFVPGPVHAGIYEAVEEGYYGDEGIDLRIVEPTSTADTLKLIYAGKADFGIADGIDVATQVADGRGARGILALAQRPLGGVITLAESGFDSPSELAGQRVGVTGVPSDEAILDSILEADGADPSTVERISIGFNGVANLESGSIDGFTGFVPSDGVQVEIAGFPTTSFAPDDYGGLRYPGLVVFSTEERIIEDPELMQAFVSATVKGYEEVIADPAAGLDALIDQNPEINRRFARASLDAFLPSFTAGRDFGGFDTRDLERLSGFLEQADLVDTPIDPGRYATNEFVDDAR